MAHRERVPLSHYVGAAIAFTGLLVLLWPQPGTAISPVGFTLKAVSGLAWGIYSALGRGAATPVLSTAQNFVGAGVLCLPVLAFADLRVSGAGFVLAVLSGAVTSAMGYALWYSVLPTIRSDNGHG